MTLIEIPTKFKDKARFVRAIFTDVENEYDVLVHLMTFVGLGVEEAYVR